MVNPRPTVREMLEFVNFPKLVRIYDSIGEIEEQEQDVMEPSVLLSNPLN